MNLNATTKKPSPPIPCPTPDEKTSSPGAGTAFQQAAQSPVASGASGVKSYETPLTPLDCLSKRFSLAEVAAMPTVREGQFDNFKYDDGVVRLALSRMTVADGAPYDNEVTVEHYNQRSGRFEIAWQYEAV